MNKAINSAFSHVRHDSLVSLMKFSREAVAAKTRKLDVPHIRDVHIIANKP